MLHNRWIILALLFLVRAGMGVQFQLVPSLAPLFIESFALTVAEIGLLIGIYQAPGIFLALPGAPSRAGSATSVWCWPGWR
ncbi:hypothetical protein ACFSZS_25305 [Seohaeicola zhoushanensis]